jgi:hypothetical protein
MQVLQNFLSAQIGLTVVWKREVRVAHNLLRQICPILMNFVKYYK